MKDDLIRFDRGHHSPRARARSDKIRRNSAITLRMRAEKGARLIFRSTWRASHRKGDCARKRASRLDEWEIRTSQRGAKRCELFVIRRDASRSRNHSKRTRARLPWHSVNEIILLYTF